MRTPIKAYQQVRATDISCIKHCEDGDETEMVKRLSISTGPLRTLLLLHFPPINLVVFKGTLSNAYLGTGFALRCFQRLSVPHVATLHCH